MQTAIGSRSRAAVKWEVCAAIYWCREIAKQSLPQEVVVARRDDQGVIEIALHDLAKYTNGQTALCKRLAA